jgi:hypothetical protein
MPKFRKVSAEEIEQTRLPTTGERARVREEYKRYIKSLKEGEGGELTLAEDENKTTIKNRLKRAAEELDVTLKFKRSPQDVVRYLVERAE